MVSGPLMISASRLGMRGADLGHRNAAFFDDE
jgi:hypothetical protein